MYLYTCIIQLGKTWHLCAPGLIIARGELSLLINDKQRLVTTTSVLVPSVVGGCGFFNGTVVDKGSCKDHLGMPLDLFGTPPARLKVTCSMSWISACGPLNDKTVCCYMLWGVMAKSAPLFTSYCCFHIMNLTSSLILCSEAKAQSMHHNYFSIISYTRPSV